MMTMRVLAILRYIEVIWHTLKPGGVWINQASGLLEPCFAYHAPADSLPDSSDMYMRHKSLTRPPPLRPSLAPRRAAQGPLLWHWADAHTYLATPELSIEVPLESVLRCAAAVGFVCARPGPLSRTAAR